MLVVFAVIIELACTALFGSARFTLGWYAGRIYSLIISVTVLVLLLEEINRLYARLARSNLLLERERDNKLMNVQAITGAIAHEVKAQPLTAIVTMGEAALRFLNMQPPDHAEVRQALEHIIMSGHRAGEVFEGLRALFLKANQATHPIDVNRMVSSVLRSLSAELKDHNVEVRPELSPQLPLVDGYGSQLEEVVFNLVRNAVEAMDSTTSRSRVLHVVSEPRGDDAIVVAVNDTGPGLIRNDYAAFSIPLRPRSRRERGWASPFATRLSNVTAAR